MSRETPASLGAPQGAGKRWTPALGQEGTCRDFTNTLPDKELRGGAGLGVVPAASTYGHPQPQHGSFLRSLFQAVFKGTYERKVCKNLFSNHLFKIFLPEKIHLEKRFMPSAYKCLVKEQCLHYFLRVQPGWF